MTSDDGITWTASAINSETWQGVTWNSKIGLFAAVASTGTNRVSTSPDGITWNGQTATALSWKSITSSESLGLFCAVAEAGGSSVKVITSPDGITWTTRSSHDQQWQAVTRSDTLNLFVAVSNSGTNRVMTSPDGITWTLRSDAEDNSWRSVVFADWPNLEVRRAALERAWKPPTGQSPKRIQDELQAAGFDVYVYDAFYWANLLSDGDAEKVGVADWFAANAVLTKQTTNPYEGTQVLRATSDGQFQYGAREISLMTQNHRYWVKGVVRSDGTSIPHVSTLGGTVIYSGTISTDWQHFLFQIQNDDSASDLTVQFGGLGENTYVEYDALEILDLELTIYRDPTDMIGLSVSGNPLVNKILRTEKNFTVEAGDTAYSGEGNEAGETHMQAGNYSGFNSLVDPYPIPTDSDLWPHFIYIGGSTITTALDIDEDRRSEFEDLCLKICPAEKWIGFIEETVEVWVYVTYGSGGDATDADLLAHLQATYGKGDTIDNNDVADYLTANFASSYDSWAVDTSQPVDPPGVAPGPHTLALSAGQTPAFALARCKVIGLA
jgi:hypothetical protein